ncbi:hypothetical protein [Prauserella endophytica]|uniref:HNH endonuclease n=1 Tax=Prauserella endophytica TaxID=1592324 RepID=A0ABY2RZY7_9PSEU|nr:hypothetical protein [Prauserella endophytica]PXY20346.1 hypothetical protein BAY59_31405 [Prauserella coralliicola]TKG66948.1 hypothetical protein FCN18_23850 [Prauserella endophytica]
MPERTCTLDGCTNKYYSRGLCSGHHKQHQRLGLLPTRSPKQPARAMPEHELRRLRRAVGLPDTGPTRDQVRRWNEIEGGPVRSGRRVAGDPYIDAEVDRLTRAGKSASQIAVQLGITSRAVTRARSRNRQQETSAA